MNITCIVLEKNFFVKNEIISAMQNDQHKTLALNKISFLLDFDTPFSQLPIFFGITRRGDACVESKKKKNVSPSKTCNVVVKRKCSIVSCIACLSPPISFGQVIFRYDYFGVKEPHKTLIFKGVGFTTSGTCRHLFDVL